MKIEFHFSMNYPFKIIHSMLKCHIGFYVSGATYHCFLCDIEFEYLTSEIEECIEKIISEYISVKAII